MEVGLKAIGFQYINDVDERKKFVKETRHNLSEILNVVKDKSDLTRPDEEIEWLKSDSFRYPFHIVWELDEWEWKGKFVIKSIFNDQTHIDLVKFANKFEAAYEIIKKWYLKETDCAIEWKGLKPAFIETGGFYYVQSVVGYKYSRADFYPYTKAYLETANYLKWYMKKETDMGNQDCKNRLFLPMCYFAQNKRFDFMYMGDFFEALNNILDGIDSEISSMNDAKAEMEAEYYAEMMAERDYY